MSEPSEPSEPRARQPRQSPAVLHFLRTWVRPVVRAAFRSTLDGVEHVPRGRPFLLVGNHSAGIGLAELTSFAALWAEHVGADPPIAGFAHAIGFRFGPLVAVHRALGSVPSTYEGAFQALEEGVSLLYFPGGDYECLRPVWQAHRVDFAGRKGFLKIARDAGVAVVPLGIRGSHFTAPVLLRSDTLAKLLVLPHLLGLKRWGISALGLMGAVGIALLPIPIGARVVLAWVWLGTPLSLLPWIPATIRMRVGEPIEPGDLWDPSLSEEEALERAYDLVVSRIQGLVDAQAR